MALRDAVLKFRTLFLTFFDLPLRKYCIRTSKRFSVLSCWRRFLRLLLLLNLAGIKSCFICETHGQCHFLRIPRSTPPLKLLRYNGFVIIFSSACISRFSSRKPEKRENWGRSSSSWSYPDDVTISNSFDNDLKLLRHKYVLAIKPIGWGSQGSLLKSSYFVINPKNIHIMMNYVAFKRHYFISLC